MEFNMGSVTDGEALFETVLMYAPKRVDVWSTYIDQLVKKGNYAGAR